MFFLHGKGTSFQLFPNVEYDSSHRFLSQTDGVFYPVLPRTDSAFHRGTSYAWGGGGESQQMGKSKEIIPHLECTQVSSQSVTHCCFRKKGQTHLRENEQLPVGTLPLTWGAHLASPVGLQNVDDPNVQQQPLPFAVPGGNAPHAGKTGNRKIFGWQRGFPQARVRSGHGAGTSM